LFLFEDVDEASLYSEYGVFDGDAGRSECDGFDNDGTTQIGESLEPFLE
jgi:hypothetical protein